MEHTCGFFIIDKNKKVLIVHPTNASWKQWSIPKGKCDKDETYLEAAIREVKEETDINLKKYKGKIVPLGKSKYKNRKKILHAFVFKYKGTIKKKLKCKTLVNDKFPEVDYFKWVTFDEALQCIHHTQVELLKKYLKD
jgi:predicted NUDIX family NTP pyrophosphohydrolase